MRILIIDDDAGLRRSVGLILGDAGYDVLQAEDGEAGLHAATQQYPDIILCDVRMPKLGGLEFLEQYRGSEMEPTWLKRVGKLTAGLQVVGFCQPLGGQTGCC